MSSRNRVAAAVMLAVLASSSLVHAGAITSSDVFSLDVHGFTSFANAQPVFQETTVVSLPQFDMALGTLTGASIEVTSSWGHGFRLTAEHSIQEFNLNPSVETRDTMGLSAALIGFPSSLAQLGNLRRPNCSSSEFEDQGFRYLCIDDRTQSGEFDATLVVDAVPLDFFIGDASFDVELAHQHRLGACEESHANCISREADSTWDGTLSVTYLFEDAAAIPEPATLFLLGTGLVGLVGYARRKR